MTLTEPDLTLSAEYNRSPPKGDRERDFLGDFSCGFLGFGPKFRFLESFLIFRAPVALKKGVLLSVHTNF